MNTKPNRTIVVIAAAIAALSLTGTAMADHDNGYSQRRAVSASGYANNRQATPQFDYARVISAEPIISFVQVNKPVRECYEDVEYYRSREHVRGAGANTVVGAIVGGVIGHQFGSGRGNDAATVAGTLIGAAIANDSAHRRNGYRTVRHSRPVQRCHTTMRSHQEERIDGYRVTYRYKGQTYRTRMPYDPGRELRVRVDIRPAG